MTNALGFIDHQRVIVVGDRNSDEDATGNNLDRSSCGISVEPDLGCSCGVKRQLGLTRVDGGKFQSLPPGLRLANLGFTVLTVWVMIFAWRIWKSGGVRTASDARWAKLVVIMYTLSALINAISSSPAKASARIS